MPGKFWTGSWSPSIGCSKGLPCEPRCWALATVRRILAAAASRALDAVEASARTAPRARQDGGR